MTIKPATNVRELSLVPEQGQRMLVVGMTGSGKTSFFVWLAKRIEQAPLIIYDTKIEPKFEALPKSTVVSMPHEIDETVERGEHDYIIVRPPIDWIDDPDELDNRYLLAHYHSRQGLPAYIDEAYSFHKNSRAGKGLMALQTRGRSKGITTVVSSQLPKFISRFCLTEIDKAVVFRLQDKNDRKRIDDLVPNFSDLPPPAKHHFYFMQMGADHEPVLFDPVPLDGISAAGYVDKQAVAEPVESQAEKHRLWI